jgi:hypothetical protein
VVLAKHQFGLRGRDIHALDATFVPFSAHTRMSGVDFGARQIRKGAPEAIRAHVQAQGGAFPDDVEKLVFNQPPTGADWTSSPTSGARAGSERFSLRAGKSSLLRPSRRCGTTGIGLRLIPPLTHGAAVPISVCPLEHRPEQRPGPSRRPRPAC